MAKKTHLKPIDFFLLDALQEFRTWFVRKEPNWRGKEHDCVNMLVHRFLASRVHKEAAIKDLCQVRIESGVKQPDANHGKSSKAKPSVRKDLVIWRRPLETAWDKDFKLTNLPWVVMEWKWVNAPQPRHSTPIIRSGLKPSPSKTLAPSAIWFKHPRTRKPSDQLFVDSGRRGGKGRHSVTVKRFRVGVTMLASRIGSRSIWNWGESANILCKTQTQFEQVGAIVRHGQISFLSGTFHGANAG